ncbi:dnaJ subfamily B member 6-like protein, partial [Dinothrombium tinctorium]
NKRKIYDRYGKEGITGRHNGHHRHSHHHHHGMFQENFDAPFSFFFRDPEEVFREFFRGDPFADFFGRGNNRHNGSSTAVNTRDPFGFSPFAGFGFGGFGAFDQNFTSFSTSTSFNDFSSRPCVKKTSTSTRFVNGRKIETKKVIENGVETVTVHEDGVLKSKTVNGVKQALGY